MVGKKVVLRRKKRKENGKRGVLAGAADKILKKMENYGGIVSLNQLKSFSILSYPVGFLVHGYGHWIGLYISKNKVEIMDSSGVLNSTDLPISLRKFLCANFFNKSFSVTPVLQQNNSETCGYYAVVFLALRLMHKKPLTDFAKLFSRDFRLNDEIIIKLFDCL